MPYAGYALMLTGFLLCAYGSSFIIMSGIGIRAMDLVDLLIQPMMIANARLLRMNNHGLRGKAGADDTNAGAKAAA